jgi:DNA (cytosine-5)-methyltransferase 1
MKLMSLFDGSGGFPLAASLCGIEPVYAAEVEPYPIAVTKNHFPKMKHLGDVSKVKGGEIEPVDIITFGSPCQDMSIAGKRAGLKHADIGNEETTRSGLFLEAIRIIKEMREATNGVYPRYAIWENVPGAFSSNRGEDFRTVLEEFIRVKEKDVVMPSVPAAGWPYADCYSGNGWSLAYRVFDAQYWGVPQRRRRIYLVADFRGERAKEILFERKGLRGDIEESRTHGQETARCAKNSVGTAIGGVDRYNQSFLSGLAQTLRASGGGDCIPTVLAPVAVYYHQGNGIDRADTAGCNGKGWKEDTSYTLNTIDKPAVVCAQKSYTEFKDESTLSTLKATGGNYGGGSENIVVKNYIVRRLTPTECARLQGFPDWWGYLDKKESFTDEEYKFWLEVRNTYARINNKAVKDYTKAQMLSWYNKLHSDSAEYKMWGNGIALPNALYVMQGIAEVVGVHHSK